MRTQTRFLALLLLFPFAFAVRGQTESGGPARTAWEYRELGRIDVEALASKDAKEAFVEGLNKLGAEGWELIAVDHASENRPAKYVFKRSKAQGRPAREPKGADKLPSVQVIRLKNAKSTDLVKTLTMLYRNVPGLQLTADERTNSLLVNGSEEQMVEVQKLVVELDGIETEQSPPKKK